MVVVHGGKGNYPKCFCNKADTLPSSFKEKKKGYRNYIVLFVRKMLVYTMFPKIKTIWVNLRKENGDSKRLLTF